MLATVPLQWTISISPIKSSCTEVQEDVSVKGALLLINMVKNQPDYSCCGQLEIFTGAQAPRHPCCIQGHFKLDFIHHLLRLSAGCKFFGIVYWTSCTILAENNTIILNTYQPTCFFGWNGKIFKDRKLNSDFEWPKIVDAADITN